MLKINNIQIRENMNEMEVFEFAIKKHHINKDDVLEWRIVRKSIDARKKSDVHFTYAIELSVKDENKYKKLEKVKKIEMPNIKLNTSLSTRPIIVGAGPARSFCCFNFSSKWCKTYYY